MVIVFGLFCYCHSVIKSRATCRTKSRCQSDQSTVSVLANRSSSLHQDLMHSGYRGTAVTNVCLQAFSLFPHPTPLDQRPVHRLTQDRHMKPVYRRPLMSVHRLAEKLFAISTLKSKYLFTIGHRQRTDAPATGTVIKKLIGGLTSHAYFQRDEIQVNVTHRLGFS